MKKRNWSGRRGRGKEKKKGIGEEEIKRRRGRRRKKNKIERDIRGLKVGFPSWEKEPGKRRRINYIISINYFNLIL